MDVPYLLKGCRKCPYTDKSRPYILWTLADLLLVNLQNFSHSKDPNKSQTRIFNMSLLFTSASDGDFTQQYLSHKDTLEQSRFH